MAGHTDDFAARLRELKDRSGRSYGALAQRLHTSTSTLHRYCNGTTVPAEFAPAERFARACGAAPEEVLALHRLWLLADAERRAEAGAGRAEAAGASGTRAPEASTTPAADPAPPGADPDTPPTAPVVISPGSQREASRATSKKWLKPALAGLAAAAVLIPLALYATHDSGTSPHSAGSAPAPTPSDSPPAATPSSSVPSSSAPTTTPSPSTSSSPTPTPTLPTPVTVNVLADNWDTECGQWFYATQPPSEVHPPPGLPDVGLWAQPLGAVPGGHLRLQLTAQGTPGRPPVVLHTLYVHVVGAKPAPKGGYAYTMGSGCGGGLVPASFAIDLDAADPQIKAVKGQTSDDGVGLADFPFQVSGTDSQVLDVDAHSANQEVDWDLVLVWSCGDQQGTLTVNDHGRPFRTIGLTGKPAYWYDGSKWSTTTLDQ
ncbi:plasmid maintenance system antidote protein VapI [Catenulispora sp. EB89]|uniref:helix-turn-helix domain-containing protein n=1 Tax=Catenulispora sp. EB89 TaxID=3156257 RepID=UPI0035165E3F